MDSILQGSAHEVREPYGLIYYPVIPACSKLNIKTYFFAPTDGKSFMRTALYVCFFCSRSSTTVSSYLKFWGDSNRLLRIVVLNVPLRAPVVSYSRGRQRLLSWFRTCWHLSGTRPELTTAPATKQHSWCGYVGTDTQGWL